MEEALNKGWRPSIFNTDQGSQFTSREFTSILKEHGISISMDGRGRALDDVFIERLWRSVKYEKVYLRSYESVRELERSLDRYFRFYNEDDMKILCRVGDKPFDGGIERVFQDVLSTNVSLDEPFESSFTVSQFKNKEETFRGGIGRNLNRPEGIGIIRSPLEINRISFEGRLNILGK